MCGLDSTGSGQGPVAGCCECGDEPSGSCATELVSYLLRNQRCRGHLVWQNLLNFIKMYHFLQKLLMVDTQADGRHFPFVF
jgi:hypothetical protein